MLLHIVVLLTDFALVIHRGEAIVVSLFPQLFHRRVVGALVLLNIVVLRTDISISTFLSSAFEIAAFEQIKAPIGQNFVYNSTSTNQIRSNPDTREIGCLFMESLNWLQLNSLTRFFLANFFKCLKN